MYCQFFYIVPSANLVQLFSEQPAARWLAIAPAIQPLFLLFLRDRGSALRLKDGLEAGKNRAQDKPR